MTTHTNAPPKAAASPTRASPKPYAAPSLTDLGTVEAVTSGPIRDGGNIDMIIGQVGGFNQPDQTS